MSVNSFQPSSQRITWMNWRSGSGQGDEESIRDFSYIYRPPQMKTRYHRGKSNPAHTEKHTPVFGEPAEEQWCHDDGCSGEARPAAGKGQREAVTIRTVQKIPSCHQQAPDVKTTPHNSTHIS